MLDFSAVRKDNFAIYVIIYRKLNAVLPPPETMVKVFSHQILRLKDHWKWQPLTEMWMQKPLLKSEVAKESLKSLF